MKKLIILCLIIFLSLFEAQAIKIKSKTVINPYTITIEKVINDGDKNLIYGKIIQRRRFSYSISFEDCRIMTSDNPNGVQGQLIEWNGNRRINSFEKPINDLLEEQFVLEFPADAIPVNGDFSLKIGTILNRQKTPLIIEDLSIQKKK